MKPTRFYHRMAFRVILLLSGAILISVMLVSFTVNIRFSSFFSHYLAAEQEFQVEQLLEAVESVYEQNQSWTTQALYSLAASPYVRPFDLVLRNASGRILLTSLRDTATQGMHHQMMGRMQMSQTSQTYNTHSYRLLDGDQFIGTLEIGYDGPFLPTERDLAFLNGINQSILLAALLALLLSSVTGYLLSKKMLSPLNKLAAASHEISQGKLDNSLSLHTKVVEWQELAAALTHLSKSLQEQELLRIRLTADVSHELRTPLSVLQSHLEAFQDGIWEPTPERLQTCLQETERLTDLVNQLQQLASLEATDQPLVIEPFLLNQELESLCESMQPAFTQKGIEFQWMTSSRLMMNGDRRKIHQLAANLLTNALKYTDEGGQVMLKVDQEENQAVIRVSDTGIGIAELDQPYIFDRFYRTDQSRSRRSGGSGIGLAIVKAFTEAHGGQVTVASRPEQGTIFSVFLPLHPPIENSF